MAGECDPELTRGSGQRALTGRNDIHETTGVAATVSCGKKGQNHELIEYILYILLNLFGVNSSDFRRRTLTRCSIIDS